MRQFISECDPAHEYLTAVHAFLICIAFGLCISVFLPFSLHRHISGISPGRFSDTNAKASLFFSVFPQNIFSPAKHPQLKIFFINTWIDFESAAWFCPGHTWCIHDVLCTWRLTFWPLLSHSWPLNSLLIMRPSPPMNLLPRESQETGSCDPVVYAAMERPITAVTWQVTGTDGTMWALFSDKFLLPWGPWSFHRTCLYHLEIRGRFTRLFHETFKSNQPKKNKYNGWVSGGKSRSISIFI